MISEIYWINEKKLGEKRMGTMARPRGNDWLEDEIKGLNMRDVDCLVSLLESSEMFELGLEQEGAFCEKWDIEFINFPIQDVNIPENQQAFIELAKDLSAKIKQGNRVVIHCRMGIGRASLLAAAVMLSQGFEGQNVFDLIEKYRKVKVPDTEEQKEWILNIAKRLNKEE